jgi:hypothetical protein
MHEKHAQLGEFGAIPGAPNGPPVSAVPAPATSVFSPLASAFLHFHPVRDLSVNDSNNAAWIWDGFLARQAVTLLSSEPKAGKSTLVFGLMQRLLRGEPFLGRATCSPGVPPGPKSEDDAAPTAPDEVTGRDARTTDAETETHGPDAHATTSRGVIYLSEEPLVTLREKVERFELTAHGERIQLVSRRQSPNQRIGLPEALDGALTKAAAVGAGLIVIDTLSTWSGLGPEEENSSAKCETLLAKFRDAAARSDTAMLLLHHTRKDGTSARGSTALTGCADILLMLERPVFPAKGKGRSDRSILRTASRFSNAPDPIEFELSSTGYEVLGPDQEAIRKHAAVYDLIPAAPPGVTREELSAVSGLTRWQVRSALNELVACEAVSIGGTGTSSDPNRFLRKQCA